MSRLVKSRHSRWLLALVLMGGVTAGALVWHLPAKADDPAAVAQAQGLSRAFRAAAQKVLPTVVVIKTATKSRKVSMGRSGGGYGRNPFRGTPWEDMFGEDGIPGHGGMMPRQEGLGSGVIIDPAGVILTNNHVVADADEVLVELGDGQTLKATEIKTDEQTDLAVLRVKPEGRLPSAKLGDSSKMEIGDWVLAVGSPLKLEQTVSAGIISSKKRMLPSGKRADYFQTDAAINMGNSGGPLVNLDGEVIGINTAILSSNGSFEGIGFAIPSNLARWVADQLVSRGTVERSYLGVAIGEIPGNVAAKLGVRRNAGILVNEVHPDTPAAKAGIQEADVITAFAGTPVSTVHELQELVERCPLDSKHQITLLRDKRPLTLTVEVKALPKETSLAARGSRRQPALGNSSPADSAWGMEVAELTPDVARRLGYRGQTGVVITDVDRDSAAAEAGLRPGMLVLQVDRKPVHSVEEFQKALGRASAEEGAMLLVRAGEVNRLIVLQKK